ACWPAAASWVAVSRTALDFPQDKTLRTACGCPPAVRGKDNAPGFTDRPLVSGLLRRRRHVPQPHLVGGGRQQARAVRREGEPVDEGFVPGQLTHGPALRVPQQALVTDGGGERSVVRGVSQRHARNLPAEAPGAFSLGRHVPEGDRAFL